MSRFLVSLFVIALIHIVFGCMRTAQSPGTVTIINNGSTANCTSCTLGQLDIDSEQTTSLRPITIASQTLTFGTNCSQISIGCSISPSTGGNVVLVYNASPSGAMSLPNDCSETHPGQCFDQLACNSLGQWTASVSGSTVVVNTIFCRCSGC